MNARLVHTAVALALVCLTGCARFSVSNVNMDCTSGAQPDIMCNNPVLKAGTGDSDPYGALAGLFDASLVRVDTSASNVSLTSASGSVTVTLKRHGATIAAAAFPYYKSGAYVYFSNPSAANAWVAANGANADEFELAFDSFVFSRIAGVNTVVVEYQYASQVVTGAAWSGYFGGGGNDLPPHHQQ